MVDEGESDHAAAMLLYLDKHSVADLSRAAEKEGALHMADNGIMLTIKDNQVAVQLKGSESKNSGNKTFEDLSLTGNSLDTKLLHLCRRLIEMDRIESPSRFSTDRSTS